MNRILYLGLDPSRYPEAVEHRPIIQVVARPHEEVAPYLEHLSKASHVILTSRSAATILLSHNVDLSEKTVVCVGEATAELVGEARALIAPEATGEGVVALLQTFELEHVFFPHSAQARTVIPEYLKKRGVQATCFALYDTVAREQDLTDWKQFKRIVFTSPSTVRAFVELVGQLPPREYCEPIGPITQKVLASFRQSS